MKQVMLEALLPVFATFATAIIPLLIAYISSRIHLWTGMEIEARHREALQSALANAARIVAAGASKQAGIDYVLASVPDALKALNADNQNRIDKLLEPHLAAGSNK